MPPFKMSVVDIIVPPPGYPGILLGLLYPGVPIISRSSLTNTVIAPDVVALLPEKTEGLPKTMILLLRDIALANPPEMSIDMVHLLFTNLYICVNGLIVVISSELTSIVFPSPDIDTDHPPL